jgi:hypothetical protein
MVLARFRRLTGRWQGSYRLIVDPSAPARVSETSAVIAPVTGGGSTRIDYTWEYDGTPQQGSLLLGHDDPRGVFTAMWMDSWHMSDKEMLSEGPASSESLDVRGSYEAPPGPDWGWRTVIEVASADSFRMIMYNVTPDGQEYLAVDAEYHRAR